MAYNTVLQSLNTKIKKIGSDFPKLLMQNVAARLAGPRQNLCFFLQISHSFESVSFYRGITKGCDFQGLLYIQNYEIIHLFLNQIICLHELLSNLEPKIAWSSQTD